MSFWWNKQTVSELTRSYHMDEQDAREFALQGQHQTAAMLYECAAEQRYKNALRNFGGFDKPHWVAYVHATNHGEHHRIQARQ